MLCLLFALGRDRYALDTADVAEVLPLVEIKGIPHAPPGIAGVCNFRGAPVPVIDLRVMLGGPSSPASLSTRLILVRDRSAHVVGLIAEQVTSTLRCMESDFVPTGVDPDGAPYLGPVMAHEGTLIQRIRVDELLPAGTRAQLFRDDASRRGTPVTATSECVRWLKDAIGLDAASIGASAVERALKTREAACGLADRLAYWEHVCGSGAEQQALIEEVIVPETWFFRDRNAFAALAARHPAGRESGCRRRCSARAEHSLLDRRRTVLDGHRSCRHGWMRGTISHRCGRRQRARARCRPPRRATAATRSVVPTWRSATRTFHRRDGSRYQVADDVTPPRDVRARQPVFVHAPRRSRAVRRRVLPESPDLFRSSHAGSCCGRPRTAPHASWISLRGRFGNGHSSQSSVSAREAAHGVRVSSWRRARGRCCRSGANPERNDACPGCTHGRVSSCRAGAHGCPRQATFGRLGRAAECVGDRR